MEEENKDSSLSFSSLVSYIPFILGLIGLGFIILGIFLTFKKDDKADSIKITDSLAEEASGSGSIFIDVEGAVLKPGVYAVKVGDRVQNALIAGGGISDEADREWVEKNLNLAAKLVDGSKIYIPKVGELINSNNKIINKIETEQKVLGVESLININNATISELDVLPGVGAVTAQKIIDGRPYQKIEELTEKKIVNKSVWEKIKDKISVY